MQFERHFPCRDVGDPFEVFRLAHAAPVGGTERRFRNRPVHARLDFFPQVAPPEVDAPFRAARGVPHQRDRRQLDPLAWLQSHVDLFDSGANDGFGERRDCFHRRGPLSGPADGDPQVPPAFAQIETGQPVHRGTSFRGSEPEIARSVQIFFHRSERIAEPGGKSGNSAGILETAPPQQQPERFRRVQVQGQRIDRGKACRTARRRILKRDAILQHRQVMKQLHGDDETQPGFLASRNGGVPRVVFALFAAPFDSVTAKEFRRIRLAEPEIHRKRSDDRREIPCPKPDDPSGFGLNLRRTPLHVG
ncbi:hypothetical protein SDC9_104279 [bioreactor metagenome]|uniref:Uncharacterized protein n=1 Tax=bioreactor metagenome TaxID=1076179 RepID=A0A645AWD0_9ZZZZ